MDYCIISFIMVNCIISCGCYYLKKNSDEFVLGCNSFGTVTCFIKINILRCCSVKHVTMALIGENAATLEHKMVVYEWCSEFFCWTFTWLSILAACRSRLVYWLYFNVNRPLLFMEYGPVWLLFNGNWILLFCKGKTALEARKVSLDVMKYLPQSRLFLLFILFACYILTSLPSALLLV